MRDEPAIKGSGISSLVEDVAKLRDAGRAPAALIHERLTPADRALLDRPVNLAAWYDIHSYRRLAELLCEVEGRREELLRERGAAAARRLAASGLYSQMETVTRLRADEGDDEEARFRAYGRGLKLVATLSGSLLNFARMEVVVDPDRPDRYAIEASNADEWPEALSLTTEGFINAMAQMGGSRNPDRSWVLDRRPGVLRFRMTAAVKGR